MLGLWVSLTVAAGAQTPDIRLVSVKLEAVSETTANATLGDLDRDGDLDIVLAKGRHWPLRNVVLVNDGRGGFEDRYDLSDTADRTYTAAIADVDGDSDLDVVVSNDRPDGKLVYVNDGSGQFRRWGEFGDGAWATRNVTLGDLDGDGRPDIVAANRGGPENRSANYLCRNDGRGHFPECEELSSQSATTIALGDLTGDGALDILIPHRDGGRSQLFRNLGQGQFDAPVVIGRHPTSARAVALGDLDGDGLLDVVIGDEVEGGAFVYFNGEEGLSSEPLSLGKKTDIAYSLAIADMNGDGYPDVVQGNRDSPSVVFLNPGTGTGSLRDLDGVAFGDGSGAVYGLALGDVDGNRTLDIVAARSGAPSMLYLNTAGTTK